MKDKQEDLNKKMEPTKAELDILQVLWESGPSTVRFVNDTLNAKKKAVQYTSTLKQMQLMAEKGMLLRDERSMKHLYQAAIEENQTKSALLDRFLDSMYQGSVSSLVLQLLGNKKTTREELDAIRQLLDQQQKK
jgi:predicted transcriptional regulator